jgi:hypothetical protein
MSTVIVRPGRPTDHGFVIDGWWKDFRKVWPHVRKHETNVRNLMRLTLRRGTLLVACPDDTPDAPIGWLLHEGDAIWWTYVAKDYRGKTANGVRISEQLLEAMQSEAA